MAPKPTKSAGTKYDKFLVKVNREASKRGPVTKSVTIMDLIREKMPNSKTVTDALNKSQDHRNASDLGYPAIVWYFPAGECTTGETYKANDIYETDTDEDTGKEERTTNPDGTYKVIGLSITDKKFTGTGEDGKPMYESKKAVIAQ